MRNDVTRKLAALQAMIDEVVRLRTGLRKRRRRKDGGMALEPVEPPRPNLLSGGATAELEFEMDDRDPDLTWSTQGAAKGRRRAKRTSG